MKTVKIKGKITKENAYWISPDNKAIPVSTNHMQMVLDNPKMFGLSRNDIEKEFKKNKEKLGVEGKSREKIMTDLLKKKWIRLRYIPRGDSWTIQLDKLQPVKPVLTAWAKAMFKKGIYPFSDIVILNLKGANVFSSNTEEVGVGSLYDKSHAEKNFVSPFAQFREQCEITFIQSAESYLKELFKNEKNN